MRKVLIVTYYWPPAGGAGVQRVLKFAKYLPKFGWQPIVLTVPNPDAPIYDDSLKSDIPEEAIVYKVKGFEPFNLYKKFTGKKQDENISADVIHGKKKSLKEKLAGWVRLNLFIPDAKIGWYFNAVKRGLEIAKEEKVDLVFSSGPPHTTALIANKISKTLKLKWVLDFRDPWLEIVYYQHQKRSKLTIAIDSYLEKKMLNNADVITTISSGMIELFKSKNPNANYVLIPNGFDDDDIEENNNTENENFTIAYTGAISKDRVPYALIKSLRKAKEEGHKIKLNFAGKFCAEFEEEIDNSGVREMFNLTSFVPHNQSTKILQKADCLLLVIDDVPDNKGFLTGKMFEYLGMKKPIYAIGPVEGDASKILKETDSGNMISYNDYEGAFELLIKYYTNWKEGKSDFAFESNDYSRRNLTLRLTEIFKESIN